MQGRHNQNVAEFEHWVAFCLVLVFEIYLYAKKNLVSYLFCSMLFYGHSFPRQSFIQNTINLCNLQILLHFYIFVFIFSYLALLILRLFVKGINLILSSPKLMFHLLSTNQSQTFPKSLFSWHLYIVTWVMSLTHESSACKNRFDFTVWGMSLIYQFS